MTPFQEACLAPVLFLTVVLLAAVRPGAQVSMVPPSLTALVAALVLFALLVRSGALVPQRLMNADRPSLANLNGLALLLTAFVATAQVFTLVVPPAGLPALIVWAVVIALLLQALAVEPDRARLLRGLLILFGAAFMLKYVLLAGLSAPADSGTGRVLQLLFEGVTLGTVRQPPLHPAEGYLAFATIVLYLIGIAWLPSADWRMVRTIQTTALVIPEDDR
jgi:hypothetical protein